MRAGAGLLLLLGAGVAAALLLPRLRFDHGTRSLLRADAAADRLEDELQEIFGAEDILLVAWETGNGVDAAEFRRLRDVTRALASVAGLEEVYSLASPQVRVKLDGRLRPLREEDFATPAARAAAQAQLDGAPYEGIIHSPGLDVVAVASSFAPGADAASKKATLARVRAVAAAQDRPVHVAGVTPLSVDASRYAVRDLETIGLLALAVSVAVLFLLCRSVRETVVAVATTGLPPLLALGAAALLGIEVTALGAALFPVMAVVGITSSVHLLNAYGDARRNGAPADAAPWQAARRLRGPIVLSLLTTAAAFVSLQATGVPAFRGGGYIVALGLGLAVPVVLIGLPAALAIVKPPLREAPLRRLDDALVRSAGWVVRRRVAILAVAGALLVAGVWAARRAPLEVAVLQAFRKDTPIAETYAFLEQRLTATVPLDVVLHAGPDATDAAVLADLRGFDARAEAIDGVDSSLSLARFVAFGRRVSPIENIDDAFAVNFLRSVFPAITNRFEHRPTRRYRIKVRVREGAPPAVLDRLEEATRGFATGRGTLTGLYVRAVGTTRHLARDLARGAVLMVLLVGVTVGLALRSWRLGVAALLPNALPPVVVFGGASLLGIALDVGAVAVGAVAVGLAVDDTLHVVFGLAAERRAGRAGDAALEATQRSVGRALVFSTLVLVAGLACLGLSAFLPTARFGLFCAAASAVALPADLVALPALVRVLQSE